MWAARYPWRTYLGLVLAATMLGLGGQCALSAAAAAPVERAELSSAPRNHAGSATFGATTNAPAAVPYLAACSGLSEPTYGLIDPCLPRQSPFDP